MTYCHSGKLNWSHFPWENTALVKWVFLRKSEKLPRTPPTKVFYWHESFCKVAFIKNTKDFIYIIFSPSFFCDTSVLVMQNMLSVMKYLFGVWEKVTVVVLVKQVVVLVVLWLSVLNLYPLINAKGCPGILLVQITPLFGLSLVNNLNCGLVPFCVRTVSPVLYRL